MKKIIYTFLSFTLLLAGGVSAQAPGFTEEFGVKALYIDGRAEVLTIDAIKATARDISQKGFNTILLEYEATFPFEKHATLCNQYAYTKEEVKDLVAYCASVGIDVIPLQNCFGHVEYILRHDRYFNLREDPGKEISQVCPLKIKEATPVFSEIFAEVAALHPSKYFHIGADETYLLGDCKDCSAVAAVEGKSRLFVDYIKAMSQIVIDMGKIPVIWADIILMHPEAVAELPEELIFIDWNYGWDVNRFGKLENLFDAGVKMWGATALRSAPDNLFLTQWEKHFDNLATFVPFSRRSGYTGMVQTSWSTGGTYGFHYDTYNEIINMQPIRLVYPTAGFNILIDATAKAFNQTEPLDPEAFVKEYALSRYGLNTDQAQVFWEYFAMPQEIVRVRFGKDEAGTPIPEVLDQCLAMQARFGKLSAKKNKKEFAHYDLMLDMRVNYLKYKVVELAFESPSYDRSQASGLAAQLKPLVRESKKLDRRFKRLNKGYLQDGEIAYANHMRSEKMKSMYAWLRNNR